MSPTSGRAVANERPPYRDTIEQLETDERVETGVESAVTRDEVLHHCWAARM